MINNNILINFNNDEIFKNLKNEKIFNSINDKNILKILNMNVSSIDNLSKIFPEIKTLKNTIELNINNLESNNFTFDTIKKYRLDVLKIKLSI
jgi:hypothetical protein